MTEIEKIKYAKTFIDKLANGINPLDDTPISEDDVVNNVRLSRCFFYVSDVLRQVIENGGVSFTKPVRQKKQEFSLSDEARLKIQISKSPISVREISAHLNSIIDLNITKKISAQVINNWLLNAGFLEIVSLPDGKRVKLPTVQGNEVGIFSEEKTGQYGTYISILFSSQAQQFIYDNVETIIEMKFETKSASAEFYGRPWTKEHDECLIDLFKKNVVVSEIAFTLKRTNSGIRARLKKLGLIKYKSDAK